MPRAKARARLGSRGVARSADPRILKGESGDGAHTRVAETEARGLVCRKDFRSRGTNFYRIFEAPVSAAARVRETPESASDFS